MLPDFDSKVLIFDLAINYKTYYRLSGEICTFAHRFEILFVVNAKLQIFFGSCRKVCPLFCRLSRLYPYRKPRWAEDGQTYNDSVCY